MRKCGTEEEKTPEFEYKTIQLNGAKGKSKKLERSKEKELLKKIPKISHFSYLGFLFLKPNPRPWKKKPTVT